MSLIVAESFFTESSYSAKIADSSASSADDIPSESPTLTGVEDILLAGLGEDDDDESRSGLSLLAGLGEDDDSRSGPGDLLVRRSGPGDPLLGTALLTILSFDWLVVLFVIEVSGEFTPESVGV